MKKGLLLACASCLIGLTGCFEPQDDDHLSSVPITNNPNIIPSSAQQSPGAHF